MHGQPPKEGMSGSVQPQADYRSRGSARGAGAPLSRWERAAVSRLFVSGPRPSLGGHAALVFTLMRNGHRADTPDKARTARLQGKKIAKGATKGDCFYKTHAAEATPPAGGCPPR